MRFDVLTQIHGAMNQLDTSLNEAIDARDMLHKAVASGASGDQAQAALDNLNRDIADLVDVKIQSGEGRTGLRDGPIPVCRYQISPSGAFSPSSFCFPRLKSIPLMY